MRRGAYPSGWLWSVLWRWGPPALWMGIISGFSTDAFSAEETGRFLLPLLRWMLPGISPETLDFVHVVIRKGMHVTEFGVLALLWYRALRWGKPGWNGRTALGAFLLSAGFALADEFHQAFVPSRTGSLVDAGWDSLGAILSVVSRWATVKRWRGRRGDTGTRGKNNAPGDPQCFDSQLWLRTCAK